MSEKESCGHDSYDEVVEDTPSQINTWQHCLRCGNDFGHQSVTKISKPPLEGEG